MGEHLHHTPAHLLPEVTGGVFPVLSSLMKPRSRLPGIDSCKVALHQGEGLFDEFMQLVHRGQRIDADDGEELFEAQGKVGRGHLHLVDQSIQPAPAWKVEVVESQQDEQELLLGRTEGVVEDQHLVALGQMFLFPGGTKAQMLPDHRHGQVVRIGCRLLLPVGDERWVDQGQRRAQGGQVLLPGEPWISVFQHGSHDPFGGCDRRVAHIDGHPFSNRSRLPTSCCSGKGPGVPVSFPSACDDVPKLLSRGGLSPEDGATNTTIWPQRPSGTFSPDSRNGFLRSNLLSSRRTQWQQTAESALEANEIHSSEFALSAILWFLFVLSATLWCFWLRRNLAFCALNHLLHGQIMLS
jgi:hypothetical protein